MMMTSVLALALNMWSQHDFGLVLLVSLSTLASGTGLDLVLGFVVWPLFNSAYYLRQGGNVFARVCLCVRRITKKVMGGSFWNFVGMSGMANTTSDSILMVIRKESWILDHFEIYIDFNGP